MKTKMLLCVVLMIFCLQQKVYAVRIHLPFAGGTKHRCVQMVGDPYTHNASYTRYDIDLDTENYSEEVLFAPIAGIAYVHNSTTGFGVHINIKISDDEYWISGHCERALVQNGSNVRLGQPYAIEGNTGLSQGDHVHWGKHRGDAAQNAALGTSIVGYGIYCKDVTLDGEFREYSTTEFIGPPYGSPDLFLGHEYESANPTTVNFIGRYNDGWHLDGSSQAIKDCFDRNGGTDGPGYPFSDAGNPLTVHEWGNTGLWVQNTIDIHGNESCILYDPSTEKAIWIHGGFWQVYRYNYGPLMDLGNGVVLGAPVTDEYTNPDGYTQQDYEGGYMVWDGQEVHVYGWDGVQISAVNLYNLAPIPTLNPLDAHRIEVLIPENLNRAYADVFCEDVFVHRMYEDKYVIEGLEPSTVYHIKLMFYDGNGQFLYESDTMVAVTMAEEVSGIESISILVALY